MFQVELLSGGALTVYAVDADAAMFLVYHDNAWDWIDMTECRPCRYPRPLALFTTEATT
nr:MAG TPA: hypothetical protein [Bacteriophage sp.]